MQPADLTHPYCSSQAQCEFFVHTPCNPLPALPVRVVLGNEDARSQVMSGGNNVLCSPELRCE